MTTIVIREGKYVGFHEEVGYIYRLNGTYYSYKNGTAKLIK